MNRVIQFLFAAVVMAVLSGCQTMGPSEYGVRFRKLPPALLGGVSSDVIPPGKTVFVLPGVDSIYRFDASTRRIDWAKNDSDGVLYTRAKDGNEVALEVVVLYRVDPDPTKLVRMVSTVATNDDEVEGIVFSVARADVREEMNRLPTAQFLDRAALDQTVALVKQSMVQRLSPYGIIVDDVILNEFQFERLLPNGTVDSGYADRLQEVQQQRENTERERARIETVRAQKAQELNETRAVVNRMIQEAEGYKLQAEARGISFLATKKNEAEAILVRGRAEVEGLVEQLNALAAPGGDAIIRIELAKRLAATAPRFVLLPQGGSGLDVQRLDANQLLSQIGVVEGMRDSDSRAALRSAEPRSEAPSQEGNQ